MIGPHSLTALDVTTALLLAGIAAVAPRSLPMAEAMGCVLAAPLQATAPAPPCAVARWDGWAIAAADTLGAGPYAPAVLPMPPLLLQPGDELPPGTDAVLPLPEPVRGGPFAQVLDPVAPGTGVCARGEDAASSILPRGAGERLSALDLPVLAALSVTEVVADSESGQAEGLRGLHQLLQVRGVVEEVEVGPGGQLGKDSHSGPAGRALEDHKPGPLELRHGHCQLGRLWSERPGSARLAR